MKTWFNSLSLHTKQTLVIILINAFSLLIASSLYLSNNVSSTKELVEQQMSATAEIIAGNITSSLLFHDALAAQDMLNSLITDDSILYASIYDDNKAFFANFDSTTHFQRPDFNQYEI